MKKSPAGKDVNFRKAIAHAIDYETLIKVVTGNSAMMAYSIYQPGIFGYSPSTDISFKYDIELAKKYLKKSRIPKKKRVIHFTTRGDSDESIAEGKLIKEMLSKIGIKVIVTEVDFTTFLGLSREGNLEFRKDGWIYPDSENVLQLLANKNISSGLYKTHFSNKEFDLEFSNFKGLSEDNEKITSMAKLEKIVKNEVPWIPVYNNRSFYLYRNRIKNFRPASFIRNYFKYLNVK